MQLLIPFTPHLAHECLEILNCKEFDKWPKIKGNMEEQVKFAIQINGKTRDVITLKKNTERDKVNKFVLSNSKASKYILNKTILKTIFVKNKIINYIIK